MRDTLELRRRIEAILGITVVTVGAVGTAACDRTQTPEPRPDPKTTTTATTTTAEKPIASVSETVTAAETTPPTPPPFPIGPTGGGGCSPIAWCGPAATSRPFAKPGTKTVLGCAEELGEGKVPAPIPYFAYAELDVSKTKEERADAGAAGTCCYQLHRLCGGGRPLVEGDGAEAFGRVAEVRAGTGWRASVAVVADVPLEHLDDDARLALGERWLRDARVEHASVASFARASLELMSVGAPAELVEGCHRAALEEVRHAEACFALAARFLGRDVEPGPLTLPATRSASLVDVARTTLLEGCHGESRSALSASREAASCDDPSVRAVLEMLARDEATHAALAFRVVRWCVARGGAEVRAALSHASVALPEDETRETIVRPLLAAITTLTVGEA